MAGFDDEASSAIDVVFAEFGFDATITRENEAAIACRLLRHTCEEYADLGSLGENLTNKNMFQLRKSEMPDLQRGDVIIFDNTQYKVSNSPELKDRFKLIYTVKTNLVK
mgnify:CR=1 FL=1